MSAISYTLCAMDAINLLISRTRRGRCAPCSPMNGSDLGPSDGIGAGQTLRRLNPAACTYTSPLWRCQRAKKYLKKDCKKIVRLQQKAKPTSPLRWQEVFFFFIFLVFFLLKMKERHRNRDNANRRVEAENRVLGAHKKPESELERHLPRRVRPVVRVRLGPGDSVSELESESEHSGCGTTWSRA